MAGAVAAPTDARPSISVLAYEGMSAFETGIVTEVFGVPWPGAEVPSYNLTVCAEDTGAVPMIGGATLHSAHGLEEFARAGTVIVPSVSDVERPPSAELVTALREAHRRGARIVSICTGAFALAGAGLLDDRRATTHWQHADRLQARYPRVWVDPHPLYVDEGDVLTSAGSSAGIDLCLHLVRQDFGARAANALARCLVAPAHREGGQAQFIESPVAPTPGDDRIAESMAWALRHLDAPLTVAQLARQAHMSVRSYLRHFARCTGTSPIRWLIAQRIQASLPLLESSDSSVEQIAAAVGFDRAVTFRHHFARMMHTSPSAYRRTFQAAKGVGSATK